MARRRPAYHSIAGVGGSQAGRMTGFAARRASYSSLNPPTEVANQASTTTQARAVPALPPLAPGRIAPGRSRTLALIINTRGLRPVRMGGAGRSAAQE